MATEGTVYKTTTLVGTSNKGFVEAGQAAISRARKTLRGLRWFEVKEQRGRISETGVEYQVTLEVGFELEAPGK